MTNDISFLRSERTRLWSSHPIITESAILPTFAVQNAVSIVMDMSRKSRASCALWADPLSGKTSCLRVIHYTVEQRIPGCGVLVFEAVEDENPAEGRLLQQILRSLGFAHKIDSTLAGKRDQVKRALIACAGEARHLFILIDEAQELSLAEFGWLKAVINGLTSNGIKVTTVLFGQRELQKRRDELYTNGRSDLGVRFMKKLIEFKRFRGENDFAELLNAIDEKSEYPAKSNWTYTQLLFPQAYSGGFRFRALAPSIWKCFGEQIPPIILKNGLTMELVAATLAQLCLLNEKNDAPDFSISNAIIVKAIKKALAG
jgi:AAA domain